MNGAAEPPWVTAWREWVGQLGETLGAPARDGATAGFASAYLAFARDVQRLLAGAAPGEFAARLAAALRGGAGDEALNDFLRAAPAALLKPWANGNLEAPGREWSALLRRWSEEWLALPLIGPQREWLAAQQRVQRAALAEEAARERVAEHYRCVLRAAQEGLAASLERDDGPAITSLRGLYDLWIDQAEAAYGARVMSAAYAADFGAWVNAGSDLHLAAKDLFARFASALDAPRREEIDTLLARQRALETELTALKAAAGRAAVVPPPVVVVPPAAVPVKSAPVKKATGKRTARSGAVKRPARPASTPARKPPAAGGEFDIADILRRE